MSKSHSSRKSSSSTSSGSGGMACVRVTLIAFNLLTLSAGLATLAIGLLLLFSKEVEDLGIHLFDYVADEPNMPNEGGFWVLSIILITLGSLVTFISFLGCFGACINSRCLLVTYLISVGLILALQFLVSVFAIIYRQPMTSTLRDDLINTIKFEYKPNSSIAMTWGSIHQTFGCCGVDGYSDWFLIDAWPHEKFVPDSCCIEYNVNNTGCGEILNPSLWYKPGCLRNIQFAMMEKLHYLACAIITLVFLQLYGIIASTLLFYHVKDPKSSPTAFKSISYELARR